MIRFHDQFISLPVCPLDRLPAHLPVRTCLPQLFPIHVYSLKLVGSANQSIPIFLHL